MSWRTIFSLRNPSLLRVYSDGQFYDYVPNSLERIGDKGLTWLFYARTVAVYAMPIILPYGIRKGWASWEGALFVMEFLVGFGLVYSACLFTRSLGRYRDPLYCQFMQSLENATQNYTAKSKKMLDLYDYEFSSRPVDFDVKISGDGRIPFMLPPEPQSFGLATLPAFLLGKTIGIRLVYPGSIVGSMISQPLLDGRTSLILKHGGERFKVATNDNNEIDVMYVNQSSNQNGKTLVLCCEGNAGFYEIGIMSSPLEAGFSVLGWNHPGFGGSTGLPYPAEDINAANAVMQFAITKLHYKPENIVVMGWSIGGFTASNLAVNYPNIKGLVLDATFDNLEPLAVSKMPPAMSEIIVQAIRRYVNLKVSDQLDRFRGNVHIVRRLKDEMITVRMYDLKTNRGNYLAISLLKKRYPNLVSQDLEIWLEEELLNERVADATPEDSKLTQYFGKDVEFPCYLGEELSTENKKKILASLMRLYLTDVATTHCTPLPVSLVKSLVTMTV